MEQGGIDLFMTGENNNKELLSQVSDAAGEQQLAEKIRAEVAKKGEQLSKFLELVTSFADDIPDEAKRYGAALKAMAAAADLKKDDLLAAADEQLTELHEQRKGLVTSVAERRSELRLKEQKAKEIRKQIDLLNQSIKRLEDEEKELIVTVASGETELKTIESKLDSVIQSIENDITEIKDKLNENFAKAVAPAPVPEKVTKEMEAQAEAAISSMVGEEEKAAPTEEGEAGEEEEEVVVVKKAKRKKIVVEEEEEEEEEGLLQSPIDRAGTEEEEAGEEKPKETKKTKSCPVCSNPMDWYSVDKLWKCFVCGHEE